MLNTDEVNPTKNCVKAWISVVVSKGARSRVFKVHSRDRHLTSSQIFS